MSRYIVKEGSDSGHCCFQATVLDTYEPVVFNGEVWQFQGEVQYEVVAECFDVEQAERIAAALNAVDGDNE